MSYKSEWYKLLKDAHLCTNCKCQDAYTLAGRSHCYDCTLKDRERHRKWRSTPEGRAAKSERNKQWSERNKALGLCVKCGIRKPQIGRLMCKACVVKRDNRRREQQIQDGMNWPRGSNGICWQCNKRPVLEGMKLCQECYDSKLKILQEIPEEARERGRDMFRRLNSVWRQSR